MNTENNISITKKEYDELISKSILLDGLINHGDISGEYSLRIIVNNLYTDEIFNSQK